MRIGEGTLFSVRALVVVVAFLLPLSRKPRRQEKSRGRFLTSRKRRSRRRL